MNPLLDSTIHHAMRETLDKFFDSLHQGAPALLSFLTTLSTFQSTVRTNRDKLRPDTLISISKFSTIISTVSSDMLELETAREAISNNASEIVKVLDHHMEKLSISDEQTVTAANFPAYIKPSRDWLLANLHNPYPSKNLKKDIARRTNTSVKDIDAWFIDVRRRIGWNKLRKTLFSNKQEKIIAAATAVFRPKTSFSDDLKTSLISEIDLNDKHRSAFIAMANTAKSLYADKFPFDDYLVHPLPNTLVSQGQKNEPKSIVALDAPLPYPTPEPSPSSYIPDQSGPSTPPLVAMVPTQINKKRRLSTSESEEESLPSPLFPRPAKRLRNEVTEVTASLQFSVSTTEDTELSHILPNNFADPQTTIKPPILKRKRCLSDGECRPSKRPHNSPAIAVPRLQAVSNPLPMAKILDDTLLDDMSQGAVAPVELLSDSIPSPAYTEDPTSLDTLHVNDHQYGSYFCEDDPYLSDLGSVELGTSLWPPLEKTSLLNPLSFTDTIEEIDFLDVANLHFDVVPSPAYSPNFRVYHTDDFSTYQNPELTSFAPGLLPGLVDFSGDSYSGLSNLDDVSVLLFKSPVPNNLELGPPQSSRGLEEQRAKRARAQALREELALYEAEGL